jgi:predicted N-acetyltransferase YhbS
MEPPDSSADDRQRQVERAVLEVVLPPGITIRAWAEADFAAVERLSDAEGWPTPRSQPAEALAAWRRSWPALVAADGGEVIGFLRAVTDGAVTTYVAEILVAPERRRQGIGAALIETCHVLCPSTRLDLLSTADAGGFYAASGFRPFPGFRKSYQ